ncbi:diguanylate phosphodiesterase [Photobacterium aphoticum]|uniref:Diguanylate phosphodiesterase n=1 Tax=Photobacterium aphoticum TaxID=754436 RepID=A0A0J1GP34_9GAMM|nr:diguanylate phosphodiesterase [Photobacterium aphoticum]
MAGWLSAAPQAEAASECHDALVLHSYHRGMHWADSLQTGLVQGIGQAEIDLHVNYMDTKRYQSLTYLQALTEIYRAKLKTECFKSIVAVDNHALWLLNELADTLEDTPVIFVGVNDYHPSQHARLNNVIGLLEQTDPSDNIALAQSLQPALERIYIIADHTTTGQALWTGVAEHLASQPPSVEVIRIDQGRFADIFAQMAEVPANSAIIFISYYHDSDGAFLESGEFLAKLTSKANAPVYASFNYMLEDGAVGGVMTSGYDKGFTAGQVLTRLLNGEITRFPSYIHSTGKAMFSTPMLTRWQLDISHLERPATQISPLLPWFQRYQRELKVLGLASGIMGGVIVMLMLVIRRLRKGEQQLQQSHALFEGVFDQSFQFIGILDADGQLVSGNLALQELVGQSVLKYDRPLWRWYCWNTHAVVALSQAFASVTSDQPMRLALEIQSHDDGLRMLDVGIKRLPAAEVGGAQFLFEARDVTSRHQMEETLREREISYRLLYEQQPVMLMTVDSQARIQSVNQFAADLLGYSKRELLGHKITSFYADEDMLPQQCVSGATDDASQRVWRRQLRYCCADGRQVWIREAIRQGQHRQLMVVGEDITATYELEARLAYQACHDDLTDLHNRSHFEQQLDKALQTSREQGAQHAMCYIDLDQFKIINDTAGHEAGDEALKQVALLLQDLLQQDMTPRQATLARLGGDEFAVILFHCTLAQAEALGQKVLKALEATEFYWQNTRFSLSASIGLRMIDDTAGSAQQVHAQADTACYAAKDEGRNRLHVYHPDDEELRRRELEMECVSLIRRALADRRLEIYAQQISPLISGADRQHYEILVRIRHENGDMISPALFMPAAERYNLAHRIDRYVVTEVVAWLRAHPEAVAALDMCAINLSGQSMGDKDFVQFLLAQISQSGLPTHKLCLEITETAAISNLSEAIRLFGQLRELGCRISLDDFGSGLSSFGYLKRMPVDIIKIDGMFVRDIANDEMDFAMVKAINELAKKMGKQTVAEFVEDEAILARLETIGVDYAQGYLFGRPQPLDALVAQLSERQEVV